MVGKNLPPTKPKPSAVPATFPRRASRGTETFAPPRARGEQFYEADSNQVLRFERAPVHALEQVLEESRALTEAVGLQHIEKPDEYATEERLDELAEREELEVVGGAAQRSPPEPEPASVEPRGVEPAQQPEPERLEDGAGDLSGDAQDGADQT